MEYFDFTLGQISEKILLMKNNQDDRFKFIRWFISCHLLREIVECIEFLHERNPPIIHRDIKPGNILVSSKVIKGRFVKLADFGIARMHYTGEYTRNIGTDGYMAPEIKVC